MFVNHAVFEEGTRHQRVTSYKIYPRQASEQTDYQVLVEDIPSLFEEDVRIVQNKEEMPFWIEEKGEAWAKINKLFVNIPQLLFALTGHPSAKSGSNGDNTFKFFDDSFLMFMFAEGKDTVFSGLHDGETSIVFEGGTAHCWCGAGADHQSLEYSYASDSKCASYTQYGSNPVKTNIRFPEVIKEGSTYYLFAHDTSIDGEVGDVYLWSSSNKTTWNIMNSGNPVLEHSEVTTDWDYRIANVSVCVVDGVWHMLVEGKTDTANYWKGWYTHSNLTDLNWSTNMVIIHDLMSCPELVHVPDRNALLNFAPTGDTDNQSKAYYANLSDDLSVAANWHQGIFDIGEDVSDANLAVIGPDKDHNIIFQYYRQTGPNYQKYSDLTLNEVYDGIAGDEKWDRAYDVTISNGILKIKYSASGRSYVRGKTSFPPDEIAFRMRIKYNSDNNRQWFGFDESVGVDIINFDANLSAGNLQTRTVKNDVKTSINVSSGAGAYHTYEGLILADNVKFYIDDILKNTHTTNIPTVSLALTGAALGSSADLSMDWVLVRKYTSPEPLIIKKGVGGKADVIRAIVSGLVP